MNVIGKLKNLTKAVKKERTIDTKAVEQAREYVRRVRQAAKTH